MLLSLLRKVLHRDQTSHTVDDVRTHIEAKAWDAARHAAEHLHPATPEREAIAGCLMAEIHFRQHRDEEAEQGFRHVLDSAPGFAEAHHGLSMLLAEQGKQESALEHAMFAKNLQPNEARYAAQLGYCYILMEAYPAAEAPLRHAVHLQPKDTQSWNNLGLVLRSKGDIANAKACFLQALAIDSHCLTAQDNLKRLDEELDAVGMVTLLQDNSVAGAENPDAQAAIAEIPEWQQVEDYAARGELAGALNQAEILQAEYPDSIAAALRMAQLYQQANDADSALDCLNRQQLLQPASTAVLTALGNLHMQYARPAQAVQAYEQAITHGLDTAQAHAQLGTALHACERYAEAQAALQTACALKPGDVTYRKHLAAAHIMACHYHAALDIYDQLLAEGSVQVGELLGNYATALAYVGRFDEALAHLDQIITQQTHDPGLRMMRALIHLLHGRYAEGWDDYQWRHMSYSRNFRTLPFEKWRGEDLHGKRIVVLAEQGLGDQVMFASCLPDLLRMGPERLVIEVIDRIAPTIARSFPECEVVATNQKKDLQWSAELGPMDYFVALGDLPRYFRRKVEDFPGTPYLVPDARKQAHWRARLEACGPRPWLGFSWKGGMELTRTKLRSLDITQLAPLLGAVSGQWVNLQYGEVHAPLDALRSLGHPCHHWPAAIQDLDEFAALISVLDGVVTVCNTTVHYAGALGVPVWILAPHIPEWRYGLHIQGLPWYASSRILRQAQAGEWAPVIDRAVQAVVTNSARPNNKDVTLQNQ